MRGAIILLWACVACVVSWCVRSAGADVYSVLVGEGGKKASAVFIGDADVPTPDFEELQGLTALERRHAQGGVLLPTELLSVCRGQGAQALKAEQRDASEVLRWVLVVRVGDVSRRFEVYLDQKGQVTLLGPLTAATSDKPAAYRIHRERFSALVEPIGGWSAPVRFTRARRAGEPKAGEVVEMRKAYLAGATYFDAKTIGSELLFGPSNVAGTERQLDGEKLYVRLPRAHEAHVRSGVLVWIDAGSGGSIPTALHEAFDEFGIIGVSAANSGNDRVLADRVQLAMDALATVQSRYSIDPARVYVGGISGGGRVSSMLGIAKPEVFRGVLAIVGLNSFQDVRLKSGKRVAKSMAMPPLSVSKNFHMTRIIAVTGRQDFNYEEMVLRAEQLNRAKIACRVFDIPGLAHQMPKVADARAAMEELDGQARQAARERDAKMLEDVEQAIAKLPDRALNASERRELLSRFDALEVSPAAWKALVRANVRGVADDSGSDKK